MKNVIVAVTAAIILFIPVTGVEAANLFAAHDGGGNACSQASPCTHIEALSQADAGDSLYLAGGTYTAASGGAILAVPATMAIRGGWDRTITTPPVVKPDKNVTVLDGLGTQRAVRLTSDTATLLEGLTIRNGFHLYSGGGIYGSSAVLVLRSVRVEQCGVDSGDTSNTRGGGIMLTNGGALWIRDSIFTGNGADCSGCSDTVGGAIYIFDFDEVRIVNTVFDRNDARKGSGLYAVGSVTNKPDCKVQGSSFQLSGTGSAAYPRIGFYGGALFLATVNAEITDTIFKENRADDQGGVLTALNTDLTMKRCTFFSNQSESSAGLFVSTDSVMDLENCLFEDSQFSGGGTIQTSGIHIQSNATGVMKQTTIIGRTGEPQGAGVRVTGSASLTMENTILARLDTGVVVGTGLTVDADGILWGADGWANDNDFILSAGASLNRTLEVSGDPLFKDHSEGNYRLTKNSPARDAGYASGVEHDLDRASRDSSPDIGAYEYASKVTVGFPFEGEVIPAGSSYRARWDGPDKAKKYTLKYSLDNGASWKTIQKKVKTSSIDWKVPKVWKNKKNCLFKVIAYKKAGVKVGRALSKNFTIAVLTVKVPDEGDKREAGERDAIYWETYATKKRVNRTILKYTLDGGATWEKITPAPGPFDPRLYLWEHPSPGSTRDECRVKVILKSASGRKLGTAVSEGWFSIMVP
jgi:hypothetical protein